MVLALIAVAAGSELSLALGDRQELLMSTLGGVGVDAVDLRAGFGGAHLTLGLHAAGQVQYVWDSFRRPMPFSGYTFQVDLGPYLAYRSSVADKVELGAAFSAGAALLWLPPRPEEVAKGWFGRSAQISGEILPAEGPVRPLLRGTVTTSSSPFGPWLDLGVFVGVTARSE